jgi:peptidoglycan/LPS O-acetylase OafA/YrhL
LVVELLARGRRVCEGKVNMSNENFSDIDLSALGRGCLTSCSTSCLSTIIMMGLVSAAGIQVTRSAAETMPVGYRFVGFILALVGNIIVGYVTAKAARHAKMFHATLLAGFLMILGVLYFVTPSYKSNPDPFTPFSWILTVPSILFGAWLASSKDDSRRAR